MDYSSNKKILKKFYDQKGFSNEFEKDNAYLQDSFNAIYKIWSENLNQIKEVKYLMISEAPLWGKSRKYIYNPDTNNSQFFYRSDLGDVLNVHIRDKKEFIQVCNEIGLLILDISPFALNPKDTSIDYRSLTKKDYRQLVSLTIPTFFEEKVKIIAEMKSTNIHIFFRYARVKEDFADLLSEVLINYKIIGSQNEIGEISQQGGGIDKTKLGLIIKQNKK